MENIKDQLYTQRRALKDQINSTEFLSEEQRAYNLQLQKEITSVISLIEKSLKDPEDNRAASQQYFDEMQSLHYAASFDLKTFIQQLNNLTDIFESRKHAAKELVSQKSENPEYIGTIKDLFDHHQRSIKQILGI